MLVYITFGLVVLKYALDYIAPRTRNKYDDKAKDVMNALPLPSMADAAKAAADEAAGPAKPATMAKPVEGFGVARDHRK